LQPNLPEIEDFLGQLLYRRPLIGLASQFHQIDGIFIGDKRCRNLHKTYLGSDTPTDVLTFDYGPQHGNPGSWGEIYINGCEAVRNSKLYGSNPLDESIRYLIHGMLHLAGFDDATPEQKKKMKYQEDKLLNLWKPKNQ